jgi:hypothetical protein
VSQIADEMVCVLASSVVDREFEFRSGQINDYQLQHAVLRRKSKYRFAHNQDNVPE